MALAVYRSMGMGVWLGYSNDRRLVDIFHFIAMYKHAAFRDRRRQGFSNLSLETHDYRYVT